MVVLPLHRCEVKVIHHKGSSCLERMDSHLDKYHIRAQAQVIILMQDHHTKADHHIMTMLSPHQPAPTTHMETIVIDLSHLRKAPANGHNKNHIHRSSHLLFLDSLDIHTQNLVTAGQLPKMIYVYPL